MSLMSWLPLAFKDLLQHVPTLLFEVVSWTSLSRDATVLSKRLLTGTGADLARQRLTPVLPEGMVFTTQTAGLPHTAQARHLVGEKILELYFRQIAHPGPMFLDLRLAGFGVEDNVVQWNPTGLWAEFSDDFVAGLGDLYAGFYGLDDELFQQGLLKSGLTQAHWSARDKAHMAELFRAHFGTALETPMAFNLEAFQKSFQTVFAFLLEKKVKLTTDFLLLGVMLVTLYLSLEEIGGEFAVAEIYRRQRA